MLAVTANLTASWYGIGGQSPQQLCVFRAAVLRRKSNKVQYEVKEMYPVGGLTASCSAQGQITDITNTCWDTKDRMPSVAGPVLVEAYVQLNDGPSELVKDPVQQEECDAHLCDNADNSRQLSAWAATALPHILEDVGGRDVWVKHSVLSCKVSHTVCIT
jgi:hypothetical protein